MPLAGHGLWRALVALALLVAAGVTFFILSLAVAFGDEHAFIGWLALSPVLALPTVWVIARGRWSDHDGQAWGQLACTLLAAAAGVVVTVLVGASALDLAHLRADAGVGASDLRFRLGAFAAGGALAAAVATALPLPRRAAMTAAGLSGLVAVAAAVATVTLPQESCDDVDATAFRTAERRAGTLDSHSERALLADALERCDTLRGLSRADVRARLGGNGRTYDVSDGFFGAITLGVTYKAGRVVSVEYADFD